MSESLDLIRGCLFGGAIGDALGYAVEFQREPEIFEKYGPEGIREPETKDGCALFSDDTQMTLFTANALLLRSSDLAEGFRSKDYLAYFWEAYQDWFYTQTEGSFAEQPHRCWLNRIPEMNQNRDPGATCMKALMDGTPGRIERPINLSKGCGGVMRVAPIGLYFEDDESYGVALLAAQAAALTHTHELGYLPAAMLGEMISLLTHRPELTLRQCAEEGLRAVRTLFPQAKHLLEFEDILRKAISLSLIEVNTDLEAVHMLGEGWVAEECLAIALYCALKHEDDPVKALRTAVNHNGDSDSTGSVCGQILGARKGYQALPENWRLQIEAKSVIDQIAEDLYYDVPADAEARRLWHKRYPRYRENV
ncbi:MAG: ADP-ribosylglycohydrolase family protein [Erysipelotrichaceae bacterium]|nr:ADP-ribosylglycohydrolase family protein [Erysipelotrichaceae bacterium]